MVTPKDWLARLGADNERDAILALRAEHGRG